MLFYHVTVEKVLSVPIFVMPKSHDYNDYSLDCVELTLSSQGEHLSGIFPNVSEFTTVRKKSGN